MSNHKDDIERYLRGDMTPSEMHALEKKALQDPFLADALEGAAGISPAEFSSDLSAIRNRVSRKITGKPETVRWYYQAAAAVLLTGVSALMIHYLSDKEKTAAPVAFNTPSGKDARQEAPATSDSALSHQAPDAIDEAEDNTVSDTHENLREERSVAPAPPADRESDTKVEERSAPDTSSGYAAASEGAKDGPGETPVARRLKANPPDAKTEPAPEVASSRQASGAPADSRTVRGRVTDAEDGMPLPGVNVMVSGSTTGTVTDLNGYYEIETPPSAGSLVFSFVGLNAVEADVPHGSDDSATLDVKMTPDVSALSEVVVVGYGNENEMGFEEIKWEPAEPSGGKKAFRRYLETNMRYPRIALENGIEGKVTVQFTIEPTGTLTDFRVVRSLGYGCDEEVIRLIREGPQWKPTRRNEEPVRGKARVKLKFAVPPDRK